MVVFRKIILIFHVEIQKIHGKFKMSPTEHPFVIFKSLIIFVVIHKDSFTVKYFEPSMIYVAEKCIVACFRPSHLTLDILSIVLKRSKLRSELSKKCLTFV